MQHFQIGATTYSINDHGAHIEHTAWRPSHLEDGRCCGRKVHEYKTAQGLGTSRDRHFCCFRCNREYSPDGSQRPNWAYELDHIGIYTRNKPVGQTTKPPASTATDETADSTSISNSAAIERAE